MPPFDNVPEVIGVCENCHSLYTTKRPEISRFCSVQCRNQARPPRQRTVADRARVAAWRRRMMDNPESRARINEMARTRSREIKDWINSFKLRHGCVDCGYCEHPVALDIDHMDGKTANVSSLKSISAVQEEIERHKCVVRCANCHRIKSWLTRAWIVGAPIDEAVLAETYDRVEAGDPS